MKLNLGIVGAGGFAGFAANAFAKVDAVKIIAVMDSNETAAKKLAAIWNAKVFSDYESFLENKNIDLVYIATPPFLHYQQSKKALLAGKHVICEKPAALKAIEAEELASLAASAQLLYVVNLMQRYNPLYDAIKKIIQVKLLGNFLHGFFENYASDESLNSEHWFWDETKSGGIFIEHGVHFFDMFSGWLGEGKVACALQLQRQGISKKIIDRVQATVLYDNAIVNFYHGFDQPKVLDRQEMRLQFEQGDITLYEWVPVKMKLHGLLKQQQLEYLKELLSDISIVHHNNGPATKKRDGRFSEIIFDGPVTLEYGNVQDKQNRYRQMLTAMLADQFKWIKDHQHIRVIDATNAVSSLKIAETATLSAQKMDTWK